MYCRNLHFFLFFLPVVITLIYLKGLLLRGRKAVIRYITKRNNPEKRKNSFYPTKDKNYTEIAVKYFQGSILKVYAKTKFI